MPKYISHRFIHGLFIFFMINEVGFGYPFKPHKSQLHTHIQVNPVSFGFTQLFDGSFLDTNNVSTGIVLSLVKEKSKFWYGKRVTDEVFYKNTSYKSAYWGKTVLEGDQFGLRSFPFGLSILPGNENPLLLSPIPTISLSLGGEFVIEKLASIKMPKNDGNLPYSNPYSTGDLSQLLEDERKLDISMGPSLKLSAEHKVYAVSLNYSLSMSLRYSLGKKTAYKSADLIAGFGIFWIGE